MGPALDYHADGSHEPRPARPDSASTSSFTDALGERFLEFDLASGMSVERLRFAKAFADSPVFESAVRDRIERFEYFRHPSITTVRSIVRQPNGTLVLESKHTPGRRLSEIGLERNTTLALDVIRQLTPALVALHEAGDGVVHGVFGPERVVVTREGRLMLAEHVLGGAMVSMRMPSSRMRSDFGLALPDNQDVIALDQEDDLTELGLLALSLLVGRRVTPAEYPDQIEALVSESAKSAADLTAEAAWLRRWIERAVHVGPNPFRTAREAVDTIGELGERGELRPVGHARATRPGPVLVAGTVAAERFASLQRDLPEDTAMTQHDAPASTSPDFVPTMPIAMSTTSTVTPAPMTTTATLRTPTPAKGTARKPVVAPAEPRRAPAASAPTKESAPARTAVAKPRRRWVMPTLISLAAAQALVIGGLMIVKQSQTSAADAVPTKSPAQTAAPPSVTPSVVLTPSPTLPTLSPPAPTPSHVTSGQSQTPAAPAQTPASASAESARAAAPSTSTPAPAPPAADAAVAGAAGQRFGGVKVTAPFELQVFENGKLLGVTAGPIALVEGPHSLDLVNDSLEFKSHSNTTVKPGQITSLSITVPQGKLSVNAVPWAEVLIDGNDMGQTPLANLPVSIGQHELLFRHPTLGDQKQTIVVKATTPTRISVTFPK
jgi:hypothetical protein